MTRRLAFVCGARYPDAPGVRWCDAANAPSRGAGTGNCAGPGVSMRKPWPGRSSSRAMKPFSGGAWESTNRPLIFTIAPNLAEAGFSYSPRPHMGGNSSLVADGHFGVMRKRIECYQGCVLRCRVQSSGSDRAMERPRSERSEISRQHHFPAARSSPWGRSAQCLGAP